MHTNIITAEFNSEDAAFAQKIIRLLILYSVKKSNKTAINWLQEIIFWQPNRKQHQPKVLIRSTKGILVVEDFQQILLDSSLNPNSFASTLPERGQFITITSNVVASGKNNPNKTYLVYIQKKILLFFLQRKLFLTVRSVLIQELYSFYIFWLFPFGPKRQKLLNPRGTSSTKQNTALHLCNKQMARNMLWQFCRAG